MYITHKHECSYCGRVYSSFRTDKKPKQKTTVDKSIPCEDCYQNSLNKTQ